MAAPSETSGIPNTADSAPGAPSQDTPKASFTQRSGLLALSLWKSILSCVQTVAPTPPAAFFLVILGTYYTWLSGYQKDFINRGITPDNEVELKKALYDFFLMVGFGISFVFSALYFGADNFSPLWALVGGASVLPVHPGQHGTAGGTLSRRRKAAINTVLALVGASVVVYVGWSQYLYRVAELQEGGADRGSAGYVFRFGYQW